jgi:para-aminobenzoate synthetase / 4-amino-4-deoxychorismate lyase
VSAELPDRTSLPDIFRALFPSGSVTGAPKVRTMEIVAELEGAPRGVYCGAVGYLAPPGSRRPDARFNVAIRTVTVDTASGTAEYGAGGGITWGSDPAGEYEETVAKARVLTARRPSFELLETMRHEPSGGVRHLDLHLDRLAASAEYFGFAFDEDVVRASIERSVAAAPPQPCRVRLSLARDGAARVVCTALPPDAEPVRVALDHVPQDPSDVFLFHKTSRRERYVEARARHPDADDVLLVNDRDEVTESTIANVAVRLDGRWWTPPLDAGLLPGIGRQVAIAEGRLEERAIPIGAVVSAEGLALVSDARGWRPAILMPAGSARAASR